MIHHNNGTAYQRIEARHLNFFSDERAAEMRELFFESAAEQLQTLNDEGLELEKTRRTWRSARGPPDGTHLKGDSAACGYQELSELAHLLEDALTPEVAAHPGEPGGRGIDRGGHFQLHALRPIAATCSRRQVRNFVSRLNPSRASPDKRARDRK